MKRTLTSLTLIFITVMAFAAPKPFQIEGNGTVAISGCATEAPVVRTALGMLSGDIGNVLRGELREVSGKEQIIAGTVGDKLKKHLDAGEADFLTGSKEGFVLKVLPSGQLLIAGSDSHGLAYGLLELSRLMGVSPWEWWADATPERKTGFELPAGFSTRQAPSVEYRGIFINDEDWGLMPWSSMTMEPGNKRGVIGPKTTERIFELLLRLRANTYWPPMHECTEPFFLTPGNREVAEKYGIYIGGSHCEPMASSTAVEWGRRGEGEYDYVNNSGNVLKFWEDRVKDVAGQEIIYTLGMRGVHDGAMEGAKTVDEQKDVLTKVFSDQRGLLSRYVDKDVTKVPQVFIPYKEVLDVYNAGLEVPDEVTLMWCDDNYGYIRHFPTEKERMRKGGNGIYYHVSYWGRPHDYLWLGTFSPYLLYQQMGEAYDRGIRKMWILNVGDIKPAEYQTELFMDMAWNMDSVKAAGVSRHLEDFLAREFGEETGKALLPVMKSHYRLAYIRKPEFLGNTRCEERGPGSERWKKISDLPWSDRYVTERLKGYDALSDRVESLYAGIDSRKRDEYFQLVKYPVQASAEMNRKLLSAQLARHGKGGWDACVAAYDSIKALTRIYNEGIANNGKWNGIMDFMPRKQPVFDPVAPVDTVYAGPDETVVAVMDGTDCFAGEPVAWPGLGYNGKAAGIGKGKELEYGFIMPSVSDSVRIALKFLPNHPIVEGEGLKVEVCLDDNAPVRLDYSTKGRSEEWKLNVLRNQAVRGLSFPSSGKKRHSLRVKALSEGVVLDQVEIMR